MSSVQARAALHEGEPAYWRVNSALSERHSIGYVSWFHGTGAGGAPHNLLEQIAVESLLPRLPSKLRDKVVGVEYW